MGFPATSPASTTPQLGAVVINGSTAYGAPQLFSTYRGHLGSAITRDCARAITAAIAQLYVADGYIRPELAIDDLLVGRGVLRIDVHEARVTRVVFNGDRGGHAQALDQIAARLTAAAPLRGDDVPAALREMRAIPGITVEATTRRDVATRNAFELVVKTGFSAVEGVVRVNNRGTDEVGPGFLMGQVFLNGLPGHGRAGLIFAAATTPSEYLGGGLLLDTALGTAGTRGNLLLFHSRSAPREAPVNLDDRYTRDRVTVRITQPLIASVGASLTAAGGLEADNLAIRRAGTRVRDDRLRILETSLRGSLRAAWAMQYAGNLQLRHGLEALGGGLEAADLVDDPRRVDFMLVQLQATALRRFADRWSVRLDAFAQYTDDILPDSERFKIGGDRLGRGFEVAEIAGDRGLGGKLDFRRDLLDSGSIMGRIAAYGFYDIGAAWKQDRPGRDSAATTGLGLAMSGAALTGYVEVASPIHGTDIEGRRDASVFAELSWRF
jgi:hemolysin activation/secretion protein